MTLKTKYDIGKTLFFLHKDKVAKAKVYEMQINSGDRKWQKQETYWFETKDGIIQKDVATLFETEEELINSLK